MKKYLKITLLVIIAIILVGTFVFLYQKSKPKVIVYETLAAEVTDLEKTTVATGKVEPRDEILIKPQISGIVDEVFKEAGQSVCMIGDGVNDAPALKTASVGVAMGSMGSDIAVEAADIALMNDDISKIPYLKRLSNATVKTIRLSISMSMLINLIAVTLSVLGLLNPTTGALVHNAGSCFVVLIAALLYDRKFQ